MYVGLSTPFIYRFFLGPLLRILPCISCLFKGRSRTTTLTRILGLGYASLPDVTHRLTDLKGVSSVIPHAIVVARKSRTARTIAATKRRTFSIPTIPHRRVISAGNTKSTFINNFLSRLIRKGSLTRYVSTNRCVTRIVVQQSKIAFPTSRPIRL